MVTKYWLDERQVLDKGYVRLLNVLGGDFLPAKAARISFGQTNKTKEDDVRLMRRLLRDHHTSPFEMIEVLWEVKAPIFVARQWVRHRTANWNEFSMRYKEPSAIGTDGQVDFYVPSEFLGQHGTNKQSSAEPIEGQQAANDVYVHAINTTMAAYDQLIELGVSREQARAVLPVATYTQWLWKNDWHNTMHFLRLRLDEGAQDEIRVYAEAMLEMLDSHLPIQAGLFRAALNNPKDM